MGLDSVVLMLFPPILYWQSSQVMAVEERRKELEMSHIYKFSLWVHSLIHSAYFSSDSSHYALCLALEIQREVTVLIHMVLSTP